MRKGILFALIAGFSFASIANAAEMVRYERDYYADDNNNSSQTTSARADFEKQSNKSTNRDTRFDSQYRSKHPIHWAAPERD